MPVCSHSYRLTLHGRQGLPDVAPGIGRTLQAGGHPEYLTSDWLPCPFSQAPNNRKWTALQHPLAKFELKVSADVRNVGSMNPHVVRIDRKDHSDTHQHHKHQEASTIYLA